MLTQYKEKLWFFEDLYPDNTFGFEVSEVTVPEYDTGFQKLMVLKSPHFGHVLILDGIVQVTQLDEFVYHETIAHTALLSHKNPKNILIVGGGDLGTAREVLKHPIDSVYVVDIDKEVSTVSMKFFPELSEQAFNDQRLILKHEDAQNIDTIFTEKKSFFDVIILDTTDETRVSAPLFQNEYTDKISNLLSDNGIMIRLGGSLFFQKDDVSKVYTDTSRIYKKENVAQVLFSGSPVYGAPSAFIMAWKNHCQNYDDIEKSFIERGIKTKWYSPQIHKASLAVPNLFVPILD